MNYIFVYGTLMNSFDIPEAKLLRANSKHIGRGYVVGTLYDVGEFPAYILMGKNMVLGNLYELTHNIPEVWCSLDLYEGTPYLYQRLKTTVTVEKKKYSSFIYVYNYPVSNLKLIASGDYFGHKKRTK